jgi:two-component system, NarL family, response regulator LiaR
VTPRKRGIIGAGIMERKDTDRTTVLIVDDHALVRQGIHGFLETHHDIEIVGEAKDGEEAVKLCEEFAPDVVLLDLIMPGIGGIEAARRIKQASPRTHIIVLTSYHEDEHIIHAIRAGAQSYLLKDISPEELVRAVQRAGRGEANLHPRVAAKVLKVINGSRDMQDPLAALTTREMEVLKLVADGLSNSELAETLGISEKTVKGHVSNILGKLHLEDRTKAAAFAWKQGLMK